MHNTATVVVSNKNDHDIQEVIANLYQSTLNGCSVVTETRFVSDFQQTMYVIQISNEISKFHRANDETKNNMSLLTIKSTRSCQLLFDDDISEEHLMRVILGGIHFLQALQKESINVMQFQTASFTDAFARTAHLEDWKNYEVVSKAYLNNVQIIQPKVLKQYHSNTCSYHAFFNTVYSLLYALNYDVNFHDIFDEELMWKFSFYCKSLVDIYDSKLDDGVLETRHIELIASELFKVLELENPVTVLSNTFSIDHQVLKQSVKNVVTTGYPHAFILGSVTHWISVTLYRSTTNPSSVFMLYFDSHNKDTLSIEDHESLVKLAESIIEKYREKFRNKIRSKISRYAHAPQRVLDDLYDEGIPEYWHGKEKDCSFWRHKPSAVRKDLMVLELEATLKYLKAISEAVASLACSSRNLSKSKDVEKPSTSSISQNRIESSIQQAYEDELIILPRKSVKSASFLKRQDRHSHVITDVTSTQRKGYIRRDEYYSPDSAEYKAGNSIENRKLPPLNEVHGDVFDRQRVIVDFDQGLIERQVCIVIGTGGIGMNTALTLARLGVDKIFLVDYDIYEASNLTRQCLGTISDIGHNKVAVAAANIKAHNLRSEIIAINSDVISEWGRIVSIIRQECTVIFNCVDIGLMFDYCLNSLSKELDLPLIVGQSFAWKFMVETYTGKKSSRCAFCDEQLSSVFGLNSLQELLLRFETFAASKSINAALVLEFLSKDDQFLIKPTEQTRHIVNTCMPIPFDLKSFLLNFKQAVSKLLLPGEISKLKTVEFIPQPKKPSTRYIGSWVCPCLAAGVFMVSQWSNLLTGPTSKDSPSTLMFNMDMGMTVEEQMAYDTGMSLDKQERQFANSTNCNPDCLTCKQACERAMSEAVYYGCRKVWLKPVKGETHCTPEFLPFADNTRGKREALAISRAGKSPYKKLYGDEYSNLAAVSIPALDILSRPTKDLVAPQHFILDETARLNAAEFPKELTHLPLLKTTPQDAARFPSALEAIQSGKRSCIVKVRSNYYRLKGCGNLTEGFPIEVHGDHGEEAVRGCTFEHTCIRELYMTRLISDAIVDSEYIDTDLNWSCGNVAVGFYRYETEESWKYNKIERYCSVFRTCGDRRLGDHLLVGLDALIPLMFDVGDAAKAEALTHAICSGRGLAGDSEVWATDTACECGMKTCDLTNLQLLDECEPSFAQFKASTGYVEDLHGKYERVWTQACAELGGCSASEYKSVLMYLAWRLGFEVGIICRIMKEHDISWGTLPDATGIHCNAHINNLVIQAASGTCEDTRLNFLAPVDFDMSFTRAEFLPEMIDMSHQKMFPKDFDSLMQWEHSLGMRTSLAGSDFTSTGVANANSLDEKYKLIRTAFRDTLVTAFDHALHFAPDGGNTAVTDPHPPCLSMHRASMALIRLALIATVDHVA